MPEIISDYTPLLLTVMKEAKNSGQAKKVINFDSTSLSASTILSVEKTE